MRTIQASKLPKETSETLDYVEDGGIVEITRRRRVGQYPVVAILVPPGRYRDLQAIAQAAGIDPVTLKPSARVQA